MDILVLFVFLILYALSGALTLLIHYYYRLLFPGKGQYDRDELVNIRSILINEMQIVYPAAGKAQQYLALIGGSIIGFIFTYIGGIYGENYESYLFHSAVLPAFLYYGLGFLKSGGLQRDIPPVVNSILEYDFSLFLGFTLSVLAKTILVYGIYHVISFVWIFPNIIILMGLLVRRIVEKHKKEDYKLFFPRKTSDN